MTVLNIFWKKIISSNTKRQKQLFNFVRNTWKYWWNETDDEKFHNFSERWNLIFLVPIGSSHRKLFSVLFQANIYIFSFQEM